MTDTNTDAPEVTTAPEAITTLTPEDLTRELEKTRREAAKYRTERNNAREAVEAAKTAAERAGMDEVARAKAERDDLAKKLETLETEKGEALMRAALARDVTDLDYAIYKIQKGGEKYLNKDGTVDTAALLKDNPALKATPDPKPGPAPTTGGGGGTKAFDMNAAIRKASGRA